MTALTNPNSGNHNPKSAWLALFSMLALLTVIAVRVTGPSDLWEYTQFKTIGYTTDIIVNGGMRWILPMERGEYPATKPPLYNWLAVPFVKWLGFNSELAHKFPSIIALCLCWLALVRLGRRLDPDDQSVGWFAGLIGVSNYMMFKLGYIARTDMLLTLWLTLAWMAATAAFIRKRRNNETSKRRNGLALAFWLFVALAMMTKGPPAVVAVVYALIAARVVGGSWRSFGALHPIPGLLATGLIGAAWLFAIWRIDPHHLSHTLWHNELLGRITGTGPEGMEGAPGLQGWLKSLPYQPLYFLGRFFPWSVLVILAIIGVWQGKAEEKHSESVPVGHSSLWMRGAVLQVLLVIGIFTMSAGKRPDYIAAAFPPGALLAAWWLLRIPPRIGWRLSWLAPATAAMVLAALMVWSRWYADEPAVHYGDSIRGFIDDSAVVIAREPMPVGFCLSMHTHVQAMLGSSRPMTLAGLHDLALQGGPFWLVTTRDADGDDCTKTLRKRTEERFAFVPVVRSELPPNLWPLTLYRVEPQAKANVGNSSE